jgi:MoxR-like ATPase
MNWQKLPIIKINYRYTWQTCSGMPPAVHVFDERSRMAVEAAWSSGRPLLVRGEPGTGKSQLARAVAEATGWRFVAEVITAQTEVQDLWYRFDAVSRLGQAQILSAITPPGSLKEGQIPEALNPEKFLSPGILWWAYDWQEARKSYKSSHYPHFHPALGCELEERPAGVVLLIDEIDKADADLPNSLLETLDMGSFRIPWINRTVGCQLPGQGAAATRPLVIITTNEDRQLPPAFVRRCLVLHLALPDEREKLVDFLVARGKQHFANGQGQSQLDPEVLARAASDLWQDRQLAKELGVMPPGQAEYLDILRVLSRLTVSKEEQLDKLDRIRDFALRKHPGMKQNEGPERTQLEDDPT